MNWRWPQIQNPIVWLTRLAALIMSLDIVSLFIRADNFTASAVCCRLMSSKLRGIWGILLPRRGYRIQPRVSTLGNFNLAVRPHKALPRSALLEKHPVRRVGGAEGA